MDSLPMNKATSDTITLNKQKILESISSDEKYTEDGVTIRRWEGDEANAYIAEINKNNIKFLGVLNEKLQRQGYGINYYTNGEKYFGNFNRDLRSNHGIYIWPSKVEGSARKTDIYWGFWRENCKDNHGVYLWLNENSDLAPFSDFKKASFDVYVGDINMDNYCRGCYLVKKLDEYYLYYGGFDSAGKKSGEDSFYYNSTLDKLMYGKVENDVFKNAYIAEYNDEGDVFDLNYVEFDDKHEVKVFKQEEEIEAVKVEEIRKKMGTFRDVILNKDYFGETYQLFKSITEFVDEKMNNLDILDSRDEFPKVLAISVKYNHISISQDIKKAFELGDPAEK